jgi:hypothetical protein
MTLALDDSILLTALLAQRLLIMAGSGVIPHPMNNKASNSSVEAWDIASGLQLSRLHDTHQPPPEVWGMIS